jgi:hypothetical protein
MARLHRYEGETEERARREILFQTYKAKFSYPVHGSKAMADPLSNIYKIIMALCSPKEVRGWRPLIGLKRYAEQKDLR